MHLAGRLGGEQVPDLLEVCSTQARPPILELDELMSADVVGVDALLRIEEQGAELVGLPEYLRLKLTTGARAASVIAVTLADIGQRRVGRTKKGT